jgi:ABC-type oligopeptide transport system substrate-binding subunit
VKHLYEITRVVRWTVGVVATLAAISSATAGSSSLNHGLNLKDFGTFYVNGETITTPAPNANANATPGRVVINQMFVEYFIPNESNGNQRMPVVMVHGQTTLR